MHSSQLSKFVFFFIPATRVKLQQILMCWRVEKKYLMEIKYWQECVGQKGSVFELETRNEVEQATEIYSDWGILLFDQAKLNFPVSHIIVT